MAHTHYCEFFRFNDHYCDVFLEDDHYLYAEMEAYCMRHPFAATCKEYRPAGFGDLDIAQFNSPFSNEGYIVSSYAGADVEYLQTLEPAPEDIARAIIASEERYTLECMAHSYGYTPQYVVDVYRECIADGDDPHDAFMYVACCMMEYDL